MKSLVLCGAVVAATFLAGAQVAKATLEEPFELLSANDPGANSALFSFTKTNLEVDGVTFDATLSVTTTPTIGGVTTHTLTYYSIGIGVDGPDPSNFVSDGDYLEFTMSITNEDGGDVSFLGFVGVDFFSLPTDGDLFNVYLAETLTSDPKNNNFFSSAGQPLDQVDISADSPQSLFSFAGADGQASNAHLIESVTASFGVALAAVPEPTGFLFGSLVAAACLAFGKRSGRRR